MKLDGLTVLDLSLFLPGPAATQLMADHGARVIKVENPRAPEPTRSAEAFPWQQGGETVMFRNTQRGKESIALDLKTDAGKRALLALAKQVDVVVEAFRPGVPNDSALTTRHSQRKTSDSCTARFPPLGKPGHGVTNPPTIPRPSPRPAFSMSRDQQRGTQVQQLSAYR